MLLITEALNGLWYTQLVSVMLNALEIFKTETLTIILKIK